VKTGQHLLVVNLLLLGTPSGFGRAGIIRRLLACFGCQQREAVMRIAKAVLAGAAAFSLLGSGASAAPQEQAGRIVKMDQAEQEITLKHWAPGETVGTTNSPADTYRLEHDPSFGVLKVGDQVEFLADQTGGVWTITQIQKK
jgi:Cu/Ag efflux protein CusF